MNLYQQTLKIVSSFLGISLCILSAHHVLDWLMMSRVNLRNSAIYILRIFRFNFPILTGRFIPQGNFNISPFRMNSKDCSQLLFYLEIYHVNKFEQTFTNGFSYFPPIFQVQNTANKHVNVKITRIKWLKRIKKISLRIFFLWFHFTLFYFFPWWTHGWYLLACQGLECLCYEMWMGTDHLFPTTRLHHIGHVACVYKLNRLK